MSNTELTVIRNVRLPLASGAASRRPHDVHVRGDRIERVEAASGVARFGAREIEGRGRYLMPGLEAALLIGLIIANPGRIERRSQAVRLASIVLIILITTANALSAVLLIRLIIDAKAGQPVALLASGAAIWATNVIAFALWYWEFDRGGPVHRAHGTFQFTDLLFPQMVSPELSAPDWEPQFVDYLYLSFTNATAFSPTDLMPLARWAKLTMLVQSAVSLALGVLVIARAVNILR